jgi:CheY-like chemotaxis protein
MEVWKILLVDDDPEDRAIIKDAMAMHNAEDFIHFAENGEQALDILEKSLPVHGVPCLVVLDLNMPRMNGLETLRQIKQHEKLNEIPVVIYSTSINPLEKEKCIRLGALDFFTKPISFQESKETAQKLLSFCS